MAPPSRHQVPHASELQPDARPPALEVEFSGFEFPETRLDPDAFNDLVLARGIGCIYRRAVRCPCLRIESRQPRAGCPVCNGLGYAYPEELSEPMIALVLSRTPRRQQLAVGQQVSGTVQVTFPQGVVPAQGDQLWPDNDEHSVQQVLYRSVAQVDDTVVRSRATAPDQRAPVQPATTDRLLYPDVLRVEHVSWIDEETRELRTGKQGRDFTLEGNALTWRPDSGPKPGKGFSIRYRARAVYVLSPGEPVNRTNEEGFPYRCEAQRLDRLGSPDLR